MTNALECEPLVEVYPFSVENKMFFAVKELISIFGNSFVLRVLANLTEVLKLRKKIKNNDIPHKRCTENATNLPSSIGLGFSCP